MAGGTIILKKTMIGTDSATYLPSTNATESLVDTISMGGSKLDDKDSKGVEIQWRNIFQESLIAYRLVFPEHSLHAPSGGLA